jgi:hypothetical protein
MPSNFNPMAVPGLSKEVQDSVRAAFDAMSTWRIETTDNNEKNSKRFIEKWAVAAAALGWPEQIVDVLRSQMQSIAEMQIKTIDRIMETCEQQLKSPIVTSSSAMSSNTKSTPVGSPRSADLSQMTTMIPLQFWMEQWQKPWAETMTLWANVSKPYDNGGRRGRGKTT